MGSCPPPPPGKKSPFIGNPCVSEKIIPGSGWAVILCQQDKHSDFALRLYTISNRTCQGCNSRIALVFLPKLLARNKKRFVSISVEIFL